jgi:hypothetical protein
LAVPSFTVGFPEVDVHALKSPLVKVSLKIVEESASTFGRVIASMSDVRRSMMIISETILPFDCKGRGYRREDVGTHSIISTSAFVTSACLIGYTLY